MTCLLYQPSIQSEDITVQNDRLLRVVAVKMSADISEDKGTAIVTELNAGKAINLQWASQPSNLTIEKRNKTLKMSPKL